MNEEPQLKNVCPSPSESQIREHAYHLYEESGHAPGHDWENWFKAEGELKTKAREASPSLPSKWQWHDRALRQVRDTLRIERAERAQAIRAPFPQGEGGADFGDIASDESAHHTLLAEISLEDAELAEVDAALERIRNGTYGVCEVTGRPISAARLRAVPWTRVALDTRAPG